MGGAYHSGAIVVWQVNGLLSAILTNNSILPGSLYTKKLLFSLSLSLSHSLSLSPIQELKQEGFSICLLQTYTA
jgi:hypothetical protein